MEIIGHRGYPVLYPENTIQSFKKALECGADGIEMDVHLSSDGIPFIFHDFELERMTGSKGMIYEADSEYLKKILIKGCSEHIPTLMDITSELGNARIFLELKTIDDKGRFYYASLAEKVSEIIRKNDLYDTMTVISFDPFVLEKIRNLDRRITIGLDYEKQSDGLFVKESLREYAGRISLDYFIPESSFLSDEEFVNDVMPSEAEIYVWTVNDISKMRNFLLSPAGIITDRCCDIRNEMQK